MQGQKDHSKWGVTIPAQSSAVTQTMRRLQHSPEGNSTMAGALSRQDDGVKVMLLDGCIICTSLALPDDCVGLGTICASPVLASRVMLGVPLHIMKRGSLALCRCSASLTSTGLAARLFGAAGQCASQTMSPCGARSMTSSRARRFARPERSNLQHYC